MATYRAHFLDSKSHITSRRDFEADSEVEAIETAQQWVDGRVIEIWCGPILVETIKATHEMKLGRR